MNRNILRLIAFLFCSTLVFKTHAQPQANSIEEFNAVTEGNNILLTWKTTTDINTSKFIIERSDYDTSDFIAVKEVDVIQNGNMVQQYAELLPQSPDFIGDIFFRIKAVDSNGDFAYSNTVSVFFMACTIFTFFVDQDHDGYGSDSTADICTTFRIPPPGYSDNHDDCDDNDPNVQGPQWYYADEDNDGYGDDEKGATFCSLPPTGYSRLSNDCDDSDPAIHGPLLGYYDKDHDGYGDPRNVYPFCSGILQAGFVTDNTDCFDNDPTIYPGAPELCDGKDNNCNGQTDEGLGAIVAYYPDADGDGYGDAATPESVSSACALAGYVTNHTDCDDANAYIHTGADELCDGKDNNCDGNIDEGCTSPPVFVSATSSNAAKCLDNGTITLTASGGTPPFTYSIDSGRTYQESGTFEGLANGRYTAFVKDQLGTLAIAEQVIVGKEASADINVSATTKRAAFCADDGKITFEQSGGTAPYSYSVDGINYVGTHIIRNLAPGTYTGYVKDAKGCVGILPDITVGKLPGDIKIVALEHEYASACLDNGSLRIVVTGGSGLVGYSLDGLNFGPDRWFYNLTGGHHTAYVQYARGCIAKQVIYMDQKLQLIFSARSTRESCIGANDGTAIGSYKYGGNHPEEYQLSQDNKIIRPYQTDRVFTGLPAGMYTITVRDRYGCTASADVKVKPGLAACTDANVTTNNNSSSIENAENLLRIQVSPNPTTTNFRLTIQSISKANREDVEITVVDMAGRRLYQAKGNKNQVYRFGESFAAGTYSVQVRQGNMIKTQRLIKVQR